MKYQEFIDKYNGKGIDFDHYYGFQCMDLAHQYCVEVVGKDFAPAPAAKDVWNQNIDGYDKISNSPDGVPSQGDVVIWGTAIGAYGHIAVFDHGDASSFISFDQNWPLNSLCHLQNHNYNGVLGWFHPQNAQPSLQEQLNTTIQRRDDEWNALTQIGTAYDVQVVEDLAQTVVNFITDSNRRKSDYDAKVAELAKCNEKPVVEPPIAPQEPQITPETQTILQTIADFLRRIVGG